MDFLIKYMLGCFIFKGAFFATIILSKIILQAKNAFIKDA